jgi:pyruvate carboxylase
MECRCRVDHALPIHRVAVHRVAFHPVATLRMAIYRAVVMVDVTMPSTHGTTSNRSLGETPCSHESTGR